MTFRQELSSWWAPNTPSAAEPPQIGSEAPDTTRLQPRQGKAEVVAFLRHCGCPFAEKTFLNMREAAKNYKDVDFIAVSHSDESSTESWLKSLPQAGSEPSNLRVIVDDKLELYSAWGLGPSNYAHVLSPWSLHGAWRLGKNEGIWNRPTESGSRWQTSGTFAMDGSGLVRWGGPAKRADEIPDFEQAIQSLQDGSKAEAKL